MWRSGIVEQKPVWTDPDAKDVLESGWEYCRLQIDGIAGDPSDGLFNISLLYYDRHGSKRERLPIPESLTYLRSCRDKLIAEGWEEGYSSGSTSFFRRRKV